MHDHVLYTGGADGIEKEAERLARHYGMQVHLEPTHHAHTVYAFAPLQDGSHVQFAKQWRKELFVCDTNDAQWYKYDHARQTFQPLRRVTFPILHTHSAVVGPPISNPRAHQQLVNLFRLTRETRQEQ